MTAVRAVNLIFDVIAVHNHSQASLPSTEIKPGYAERGLENLSAGIQA
jgi:hypothetical protein